MRRGNTETMTRVYNRLRWALGAPVNQHTRPNRPSQPLRPRFAASLNPRSRCVPIPKLIKTRRRRPARFLASQPEEVPKQYWPHVPPSPLASPTLLVNRAIRPTALCSLARARLNDDPIAQHRDPKPPPNPESQEQHALAEPPSRSPEPALKLPSVPSRTPSPPTHPAASTPPNSPDDTTANPKLSASRVRGSTTYPSLGEKFRCGEGRGGRRSRGLRG